MLPKRYTVGNRHCVLYLEGGVLLQVIGMVVLFALVRGGHKKGCLVRSVGCHVFGSSNACRGGFFIYIFIGPISVLSACLYSGVGQ